MKPPLRQRLRTLIAPTHLAALFTRAFPRRIDRVVLALLVVGVVAGTVLRADVIGTNNRLSSDELGYAINANRILADKPIATFKWAPGTSVMFAAAALLRGHTVVPIERHARGVAQDAQLLTGFVTLILIAILAWLIAGRWAALIAVALAATYEPLIDMTRTYLSEPLGGVALLALVASVCWARRRRDLHSLLLAGIIAGLAGLVREDFAIAVGVIMIGLLIDARATPRRAITRALLYGLAALATVAPFVVYASLRQHRFTPIVSAGPNALFLGTYLPGGGNQFIDVRVTRPQVCARFPKYCHLPGGDAQGLFALVQAKHPGASEASAAQAEAFHNLRVYMLGQPIKFAHMLWNKAWNMWSQPWSGGNSIGGGGLQHQTSVAQHQIYSAIAWIGILLGLVAFRRRWAYVVPVLALLAIALLNTFFAITPRDNVRFMPFVFLYGAAGLAASAHWVITRRRGATSSPAS